MELRAHELRFTIDEAIEHLDTRLGLGLGAEEVGLLVTTTEGWPAGLYLAGLTLAGRTVKQALVRAFDGTSAHVVDFLSTEVLGAYAPETQTFMLRTSVLERLCAELCDAVLDGSDSAAALASLSRSNLFLVPLDTQRRWFRFHHLFAQTRGWSSTGASRARPWSCTAAQPPGTTPWQAGRSRTPAR